MYNERWHDGSDVKNAQFFYHCATVPQWGRTNSLSGIHDHNQLDTPHWVELLWTSDQLVAETST